MWSLTVTFKPMLASPADLEKLKFPVMVSPKLDGIRCVMRDGVPLSRNLKPIPNLHIRLKLAGLPDFDGELIVGSMSDPECWSKTQSGVMSKDGNPDFTYFVFDRVRGTDKPFHVRYDWTVFRSRMYHPTVMAVIHDTCHDLQALMAAEEQAVRLGYEGLMIRDPNGPYKFGRSTTKEGILLKLKRFDDAEARIVGFVEQLHNANEATKDALGRTERSSHKANMVPTGMLGALEVEMTHYPITATQEFTSVQLAFQIGTGFEEAHRIAIWKNREQLLGKHVKFKYQGLTTANGVPRFPVYLGLRDESDMS